MKPSFKNWVYQHSDGNQWIAIHRPSGSILVAASPVSLSGKIRDYEREHQHATV